MRLPSLAEVTRMYTPAESMTAVLLAFTTRPGDLFSREAGAPKVRLRKASARAMIMDSMISMSIQNKESL
jgi:hypothetical protein